MYGNESSTPDEVEKQFEKIIAYKDRELEHKTRDLEQKERELEHKTRDLEQKERELELFRASLTASTPQQGIDSLPRSLPAQTDNQETGQSPLKNHEISLCMG
ncbi:hypothetical protein IMY05_015G0097700 [Salix suchowensis]|nr:hypothetical protein IMY05_015G0097700 [Salix suchowensis]